MRLRCGADCLAGDKWGQLWEEHWVLREEEEVREEGGLVSETGTTSGKNSAVREWRVDLTLEGRASTRA